MIFCTELGKPLSEAQLRNLKDCKYAASGTTLLDPIMQPFWQWSIKYVPLWLAPNLMTLIGLILNVVSTTIMFLYAPDAESEVPSWVHVMCAICLFCYQTLDALDGKQARRTGSSSPLGELFDHGCDAVSVVCLILSACIACGLGTQRFATFIISTYTFATFYGAHWESYVTGRLQFYKIDVTEGHMAIILIYLVTATCGVSVWHTTFTVPVLNLTVALNTMILLCLAACMTWMWIQNFIIIFVYGGVGKNRSTVADTSVAFPIVPPVMVFVAAYIINKKSHFTLLNDAPIAYLLLFGLILAKASTRLIVARMSRWEFCAMDSSLLGPGFLFLNQYFNEPINDHTLLPICLAFTVIDFLYYAICVCKQIAGYLNIEVFRISPVVSPKVVEASREVNGRPSRKSSARSSLNAANGTPQQRTARRSTGMRKQMSLQN